MYQVAIPFRRVVGYLARWGLGVAGMGVAALGLLLAAPVVAVGQGVLVVDHVGQPVRLPRPIILPGPRPPHRPQPPQSYRIQELAVDASLDGQVAKVQVSQTFENTGSRPLEATFVFPLPYDGAIDRLTFLVDGKEIAGKLLGADEARKIYEGHIRRNQDPALVEWLGWGMFKTSVFPIPPGATRKVSIRFTQLCRQQHGMTELMFPLSAAKYTSRAVERVRINVAVRSDADIKNVYSPSHSVQIVRPTPQSARVTYSADNQIPTSDFRLFYDVGDGALAAKVLSYRPESSEDGYFVLLATPQIPNDAGERPRKNVVFVVDRSGSMSGKKMDQAKEALRFVLNNLNEGDLFNIVAYDSEVERFRPELQKFNDKTRAAAVAFVDGIFAGGSTNIDGALKAALSQLKDDKRPNYVVFLTDGLPTAGETKEPKIVANAKRINRVRARVFSLGVGFDVNSRLLDKLARQCHGQSEYVKPNESIEEYVAKLHNRIGAVALTDVAIRFDLEDWPAENGAAVNRLYPRETLDLFAGDQLVVVGRYKSAGVAKIRVQGSVDGSKKTYEFAGELVKQSADESLAFVEKLWATRRVGEIIDQIDLHGKNQELINELVALSKRYGILTPYTAFLADETTRLGDVAANARRAEASLEALDAAGGQAGFAQRLSKGKLQRAAQAPAVGQAYYFDAAKADRKVTVQSVVNLGRKTFFLRGKQWVDSSVTEPQRKALVKIERYSPEYFRLAKTHGRDAAKYLALEGDVVIVLAGQAYQLVDAAGK